MPRKQSLLDQLSPTQQTKMIKTLLKRHPKLRPELDEMARQLLDDVDLEDIADDIIFSITNIDIDDINRHCDYDTYTYTPP